MARFNLEGLPAREKVQRIIDQSHEVDGCLEWNGARSSAGYGRVWSGGGRNTGKVLYVHRLVCEVVHGEPPFDDAFALHSCDNPPCVNPNHLSWGSASQNRQDAHDRGRVSKEQYLRGEAHPQSKLTNDQVKEIRQRRADGALLRELAADYGVSVPAIGYICKGQHYKEEM